MSRDLSALPEAALAELGVAPLWVRRATIERDMAAPLSATAADAAGRPAAAAVLAVDAVDAVDAADAADAATDRAARIARMSLSELGGAVAGCRACALCHQRQRTVMGQGASGVAWMLVGDSPDLDDQQDGRPFAGLTGRLLDNMLAECGLSRGGGGAPADVYVTHALKCPAGHGHHDAAPLAACRPHLLREIELVAPRVIIALGALAAHALLGGTQHVGELRGVVHRRSFGARELPVVVTWHPLHVLKMPSEKARVWADLCQARRTLDATG